MMKKGARGRSGKLVVGLVVLVLVFCPLLSYGIATSSTETTENETIEQSITILNPQSYPTLGGNWTIYFNTTGSGTLEINDHSFPEEVDFVGLYRKDGDVWKEVPATIVGDKISADWHYREGKAVFKVKTAGEHILEFRFGNVAYAKNQVTDDAIANAIGALDNTGDALADLQADDASGASPTAVTLNDGWYSVTKNAIMFIDGFETSGMSGPVSAAVLKVQYSVDAGYTGTNPVQWALHGGTLASTGIVPIEGQVDYFATYDLYAQGVDTLDKISTLDVEFTSNDGAGPDPVSFDYVWITVTYTPPLPPTAPSDFQVNIPPSIDDYQGLNLTWTDNADDEDGFYIWRSTDNSTWGDSIATVGALAGTGSTGHYNDTGLNPNATYYYNLTAYNANGNSSSVYANNYTRAAPPTSPSTVSKSIDHINITWNVNGNPAGTEFWAQNNDTGQNSGWITVNYWNNTGLSAGTTYNFAIKARNANNVNTSWVEHSDVTEALVPTLETGNLQNWLIKEDWGRSFNTNFSISTANANASGVWMNFTDPEFTNTPFGDVNISITGWYNDTHTVWTPNGNVSVWANSTTTTAGGTNDSDTFYFDITKRTADSTMDSPSTQLVKGDETFYINATVADEHDDNYVGSADLLKESSIVDTLAVSNNVVNFSHSESTDGTYDFGVRFYNTTHYFNTTTTNSTVTVDAILPVITIDTPTAASPAYRKSGELLYVNFTYTEVRPKSYTVEIRNATAIINTTTNSTLAGGTDIACNESFNINTSAADGAYNVTITMDDDAANSNSTTEVDAVIIDNVAPSFVSTTSNDPDTIYRDGEQVNFTTRWDASGYTVTANFSNVDSEYTTGAESVTDHGDGNYTVTYTINATNTRADGTGIVINVKATDGASNSATDSSFTVELDNTAPVFTSTTSNDPDTIYRNGDIINFTTRWDASGYTVTANFSNVDSGYTTDTESVTDLGDGNYTVTYIITVGNTVADGTGMVIDVTAKDTAGNSATDSSFSVTLDNTPPSVIANPTDYPGDQTAANNGTTITLNATITDETSGIKNATVDASAIGAGTVILTKDGATDNWINSSVEVNAPDDTYYLNVSAYDNATNLNDTIQLTVNVDNTPPASITNLQNVTGNTWINWTWTNPGDSDFNHTMIYFGGAFDHNETGEYWLKEGLTADTTYNISTRTVDKTGNINYIWENQTTTTAAVSPPSITSYGPTYDPTDGEGASRTFNVTVDQVVNVSWQINGSEAGTNTSVTEASYTNTSAAVGYWNVSAIVTNDNGTNMQTWWWTVNDTTPPVIGSDPAINDTLLALGEVARLNITVTDNVGVHTVIFNISLSGAGTNYTHTGNIGDVYYYDWVCDSSGTYSWDITYANDSANNWNSSTVGLPLTFECDAVAPTIAIDTPTAASPVYRKGGAELLVNFTYTETNPKNYTVDILNATTTINTTTVDYPSGGTDQVANVSFLVNTEAADGSYNVTVTMYDNATNSNVVTEVGAVVIDNTVPATADITSPAVDACLSGTITISADAADSGSGVDRVEFYNETTLLGTNDTDDLSVYTFDWETTASDDGAKSLTVKVYDKAGNVLTSSAVSMIVDNTAATITIDVPTGASPVYRKGGAELLVNFTYTETNPKNYTVDILNATTTINTTTVDYPSGGTDQVANVSFLVNTEAADGSYNVTVTMYDNATNSNVVTEVNAVFVDNTNPEWYDQGQDVDSLHKGESIKLYARWTDNIDLKNATLSANATDGGENIETIYLGGTDTWSNFTLTTQLLNWTPGIKGWNITTNDTAGNENTTDVMTFELGGWSNVSWTSPTGGSTYSPGDIVELKCQVRDANSSAAIENYPVKFWWYNTTTTEYLEENVTVAGGYAVCYWNTSGLAKGPYYPKANITDNATLFYSISADWECNTSVNLALDAIAPEWYDQGQNLSSLHKGESMEVYARWTDNLDLGSATLSANATDGWEDIKTISLSGTGMWSNFTLSTELLNWTPGIKGWNITGKDAVGNSNTTDIMTFELWGYSNVSWTSPDDGTYSPGATVELKCLVRDANSSAAVENYPVKFWWHNSTMTQYLGENTTDVDGYTTLSWDTSGLSEGTYYPKTNITDNATLFYSISADYECNTSVTLSDTTPPEWYDQGQDVDSLRKGESINVSARWTDNLALKNATLSHNGSGSWVNVSTVALSGTEYWSNFTVTAALDWTPGVKGWKIYANDTSDCENATGVMTFEVWGYSNVSWTSPPDGSTRTVGDTIELIVHVMDANSSLDVQNYPVRFYNVSGGVTTYLGQNTTNASGYAVWYWDTTDCPQGHTIRRQTSRITLPCTTMHRLIVNATHL